MANEPQSALPPPAPHAAAPADTNTSPAPQNAPVPAVTAPGTVPPAPSTRGRRIGLLIVVLLVVAGGGGYWFYWNTVARFNARTDDAYVAGNLVHLTPQISGTVIAINSDDTQRVQRGQVLVRLDDTDAQVGLQQAQASLAQSVRQVSELFQNVEQLRANVDLHESDLARAQTDARRFASLVRDRAVSQEDVQHSRSGVSSAQAAVEQARRQLAGALTMIANTTIATHPDVELNKARLRAADVTVRRTRIVAPVAGYVAKRSVELGQRVNPGEALLDIIPLKEVWVEANYKEGQLADMRISQPVTMTADLYGKSVVYHGRLTGIGAGSGSAFSLLPAQNATGNWIKVVQRVPVRISLEEKELVAHPLRIGLSMEVNVDIHDTNGQVLAEGGTAETRLSTAVYDLDPTATEAMISKIIAANISRDTSMAMSSAGMAAAP